MCRATDDGVVTNDLASNRHRQVVLSEVQDRRPAGTSDIGAVVHREELAVALRGGRERFEMAQLVARFEALLAELDDVDAAGQYRVEKVFGITLTLSGIGAQIEPCLRKPGTGGRLGAHGGRR